MEPPGSFFDNAEQGIVPQRVDTPPTGSCKADDIIMMSEEEGET